MLPWYIIISTVIFLLVLYFIFSKIFSEKVRTVSGARLEEVVPIVPKVFLFGNKFDFFSLNAESLFQRLRENAKKYKKSFLLHSFILPVYNIIKAEDAEILLSSQQILQKGALYRCLHSFLGTGLLTGTGKKWFFRRRLLTPAFHFNILQKFLDIFKDESEKFVEVINDSYANKEISLRNIVPRFTLNNICETALGVKLDDSKEGDEYRQNINAIEDLVIKRQLNFWLLKDFMYKLFGEKLIYDQFVKKAHDFSSNIIKKRRSKFVLEDNQTTQEFLYESKRKRFAMLDTLLAAESKGENISHKGICEEVDTFMFEGYDTTSVGVTFSLLMLATYANLQQKVFDEIKSILDDRDLPLLTIMDFNQMKYLECFIKETFRLYPPVPLISRELDKEYTIGNLIFGKGSQAVVHIFDIHRDPEHYPEPEKFIPERFLPENSVGRHPFAYLPFSAGPRNCIGQKFALLEIKVLLSNILMNYELHPVTKIEEVTLIAGLVLRSKEPIKIKFVKRTNL